MTFKSLHETPQIGLLYFFFNHANRRQTAEDVIRFLLRQLVNQFRTVPQRIELEYKKYENDPHKLMPTQGKWVKLFIDCLEEFVRLFFSRVFILLDAYDEFYHEESEMKERADLLSYMQQISSIKDVRLFITSRIQYRGLLAQEFSAPVAEIEVHVSDVDKYVVEQMQPRPLTPALKDKIKSTILNAYRGW